MKKIVVALLLIISLCSTLFYIYQVQSRKPFHCDAQLFAHLKINEADAVEVNTHVDVIFRSAYDGILKFSGSIKNKGHDYILRRTVYFTVAPSELENVNEIVFTRTESHPTDNTPADLWQNRVLPQTPGIGFYSKIRDLDRDAIIIKGFTNPLIVCIRR
ncbi:MULTISPECIES: hypothetical protein [Serratia]|uniref:hypothetical protein n=1 Tax=Serratia TaxID=613 RepID=UPI000E0F2F64|nr:hypothetical protein [Serratia fonticola]NXZ87817.1 hypothetical protein [Serratia fonticola]QIP91124.1 hypothetical protein HAP32_01643 [Serratia fonticola]RDL18814.1 FidL-like putative membrane protein [Serratia fonticola]